MIDKLYATINTKKNREIIQHMADGKERTLKQIYHELNMDTYPSREIDKLATLNIVDDRKKGKERYVKITYTGLKILGIMTEINRIYNKKESGELLSTKNAPPNLQNNIQTIYNIIKNSNKITYEDIIIQASKAGLGRFEVDHALNKLLIYRDILKIGDSFVVSIQ